MAIQESVIEMIDDGDREGAVRLNEQWTVEHGYQDVIVEIPGPVLKRGSDMWREQGELSLARPYLASKTAEGVMALDSRLHVGPATGGGSKSIVRLPLERRSD